MYNRNCCRILMWNFLQEAYEMLRTNNPIDLQLAIFNLYLIRTMRLEYKYYDCL